MSDKSHKADLVLQNANVWTVDSRLPRAEARTLGEVISSVSYLGKPSPQTRTDVVAFN